MAPHDDYEVVKTAILHLYDISEPGLDGKKTNLAMRDGEPSAKMLVTHKRRLVSNNCCQHCQSQNTCVGTAKTCAEARQWADEYVLRPGVAPLTIPAWEANAPGTQTRRYNLSMHL